MSAPGQKREHIKTQSTVQQSGDYDSIQINGANSLKLRIPESFLSKEENFHLRGLRPGVYSGRPPVTAIFKQVRSWIPTRNDRVTWWEGRKLHLRGLRPGVCFGRFPPHCNIQAGTVMESNKERLGNVVGRIVMQTAALKCREAVYMSGNAHKP
ncbi:hypothetical protein CDAR_117201 [Caerostris darwini]|uniref:Uncharacterized protein n=1 Tax=Caerostris darwini TaxID=1538125 RepID=A0AAV4U5B5_9ARAC|nr:hypothetical protein CDAR_117201 [Caerostris darwini]